MAGTDTTASAEIVSEPAMSERKEEHLTARLVTSVGRRERGAQGGVADLGWAELSRAEEGEKIGHCAGKRPSWASARAGRRGMACGS